MRFDGERVDHAAWVIMPNHVHLLFSPRVPMEKLIQAWKGHSARLLGRGPIWQRDYHDTMIRDVSHFANALRYIRRNPLKAGLAEGRYTLWERTGGQDVRGTQPSA
jgi:REP element-mobilizing transposase RayT